LHYAELHLHDVYSPLDGTSTPAQYMERAKELGIDYLAQTNHGTHAGHREFQREAKKAGIIPILGEEAYFTNDRFDRTAKSKRADGDAVFNHITLLAQNDKGLTNLRKMNEIGWTEGFYEKPRIDLEVMEAHNEGVIVLSGCMGGMLSKAILAGLHNQAHQLAGEFKRVFGERFFIEVMSHNPVELNKALMDIAKRHGLRHVVTSDCHHARKEDLWVQEAVLILSAKPKKNPNAELTKSQKMEIFERYNYLWPDRKLSFQDIHVHLNSVEEHLAGLEKHGIDQQACDNTMVVASMIDSDDYTYHKGLDLLPKTTEGDVDELLEKKVFAGLKRMGFDKDQAYIDRANHELSIIKGKGFSAYFHIALKGVEWAKKQGIRVGPGRGSGAGSLVTYSLGLTEVDPIAHNLLFERFIDPSRPDWPDLDIDFQDSRREEVKDYMRRTYGNVASVMTFGYYGNKSSVKAAARAFTIPVGEVNKATKKIDTWDDYVKSPFTKEFREKYPEVEKLGERLTGTLSQVGMHAGGLVVSNRPLSDIVPVQSAAVPKNPSAPRVAVVAADMHEIEEIGLIKFDFLGLKSLTIYDETLRLIRERHGRDLDKEVWTYDDKNVYKMISAGHTRGVFQCSEAPYTRMLVEMGGVKDFNELAVSNALVRPGAADSSFGGNYITAKNGGAWELIHPDTEWFTRETYGQIIYQEQQMHLCTELAGMSKVDSNAVRRAIGKKKPEELAKWKPAFIEGAAKKIGQQRAEALWVDLEAAANYSFNKSHAVAYSMISYKTAWLKYHYPLEFITACLNSEGDKDERVNYFIEAKRLGLRVKLPSVNDSEIGFSIQSDDRGDFIRMGLSNIKFIQPKTAGRLIQHRPYKNYQHLYETINTKGSGLTATTLNALNKVGAATFPDNPKTGEERDNFYEYLNLPAFNTDLPLSMKMQFRTLDEYTEDDAFVCAAMVRSIKSGANWTRAEIVDETGSAGVFLGDTTNLEPGQMYVLLVAKNRVARYITVNEVVDGEGGEFLEFLNATEFPDVPEPLLRVVSFNIRITKKGARMAEVVFANEKKELTPALVFPGQFMKAYTRLREGAVVDVKFNHTEDGTRFVDNVL